MSRNVFWISILIIVSLCFSCVGTTQADKKDFKTVAFFDFEDTESNGYWRNTEYTSITHNPNEVICGTSSLKVDTLASKTEWNQVFKTVTNGVPLKGGKRYSITFEYKVLKVDSNDTYFYLERSDGSQREDKGRVHWLECPTNPSSHEFKIVLPADSNDFYIIFGVHKKGAIVIDNIKIRELPAIDVSAEGVIVPDDAYEPYCMNVHFDLLSPDWAERGYTDALVIDSMQTLADAGVQWIRSCARWQCAEAAGKGKIEERYLARQDLIVDTALAHGIKTQVILCFTPPWASEKPEDKNYYWSYPPKDMNDWVNFVDLMANRLKGKVFYWEIGNEPDTSGFWKADIKKYAEYLKVAYKKLKEIDPNNKVILAGLSSDGVNPVWELPYVPWVKEHFLQKAYDAGIKDYFDILAIHPYTGGGAQTAVIEAVDKINNAYAVMVKNNDGNKPIWVNELGIKAEDTSPERLAEQAKCLKAMFTQLIKHPKVDKIFWYTFRCDDGVFGIVNKDFTKRPAYHTLSDLKKVNIRKVNSEFLGR